MRTQNPRWGLALSLVLSQALESVQAQSTERLSIHSNGQQGNGESRYPALSSDGRFVAFDSAASNIAAGDTNGLIDIFVRDRQLGTTERVSVSTTGTQANNDCLFSGISADGRFVGFWSSATNLAAGDTNGLADIFLHDRQTGSTELVSLGNAGVLGNFDCDWGASISDDGRFVAFTSRASNLVAGDTNIAYDVFVRDRQLGTTERVSVDSAGLQANLGSAWGVLSADGRFVTYWSSASNLVASDTNLADDIFVRDRQSGTTERVSVSSAGTQSNATSGLSEISADGRFVLFDSPASNLVPGDTNATSDMFLRDRLLGTTERINLDSSGAQANAASWDLGSISPDGRFVVFQSDASNLVAGDTNALVDIFLRDRQAATTERVNLSSSGVQGDSYSYSPQVSSDGRWVAFWSLSTNLVAGDTNAVWDVFMRDRGLPAPSAFCMPGSAGVIACPCSNAPSGVGRGCDNSAGTGGAWIAAGGIASLASDTLVFSTGSEKPTATSIVLQGTSPSYAGIVFGQGVRCIAGVLKRLYVKTASGGSITAPVGSDPSVSLRSATVGNPISAGEHRYYMVYYRDPIVLGGCLATNTYNATDALDVLWGQ